MLHAYPTRHAPGCLRYEADIEDGDLEIVISDDGQGLSDDHESDGLGLGLQIIAAVSERLRHQGAPARRRALDALRAARLSKLVAPGAGTVGPTSAVG